MVTITVEQFEGAESVQELTHGGPVAITQDGEIIAYIGTVNGVPLSDFEETGDEDYTDNGGASDPDRIAEIRAAVDNDYWGD